MNKTILLSGLLMLSATNFAADINSNAPTTAAPEKPTTSQTLTLTNSVDCHYHISTTTTIAPEVVLTWSEKAIVQAFDYDSANIDKQFNELQACFTAQGWQGFIDALTKSGNLNAIKTQNLSVSSQIEGKSQISATKDSQWSVQIPLHVVYQNDKEKLTQLLNINLVVARKANGDLGIVQVIAAPRGHTVEQPVKSN